MPTQQQIEAQARIDAAKLAKATTPLPNNIATAPTPAMTATVNTPTNSKTGSTLAQTPATSTEKVWGTLTNKATPATVATPATIASTTVQPEVQLSGMTPNPVAPPVPTSTTPNATPSP